MADRADVAPFDLLFDKVVSNLNKRVKRALDIFSTEIAATEHAHIRVETAIMMMVSVAWAIAKRAGLSGPEFVGHVAGQIAAIESRDV